MSSPEFGFAGCTENQKKAHKRWCVVHGYQPYVIYRELADAAIANAGNAMMAKAAKYIEMLRQRIGKPQGWSSTKWKSYCQYRNRSVRLLGKHLTPEEWETTIGEKKRRTKFVHPAFDKDLTNRFLRNNAQRKYKGRVPLTPEQYLANRDKRAASKEAKVTIPQKFGVFKRPKEEIIRAILAKTKGEKR